MIQAAKIQDACITAARIGSFNFSLREDEFAPLPPEVIAAAKPRLDEARAKAKSFWKEDFRRAYEQ